VRTCSANPLWLLLPLLSACGRYDNIPLPPPPVGPRVEWHWQTHPNPVLPRGQSLDVLNPSVVRWQGEYLNLYSLFDGERWHTALARSRDGLSWRDAGIVLRSPDYIAANGAVIDFKGELLYVYQRGSKGANTLGLARSPDGKQWTTTPGPVLNLGPRMSWDEISIGDPYLIRHNDQLYLFYLGEDRARRQRLGLAKSRDGLTWVKHRGPLLELGAAGDFDENGLGEPAVFAANGAWVMLYTGRDRAERRAMGYAISRDGKQWQKLASPVLRGDQPWNAAVVCDATVLTVDGKVRIWFGGGDLPKPDERLNGQIGYAELPSLGTP
jgi:predicted GH43/DUF377 family glycosyl hydrolase